MDQSSEMNMNNQQQDKSDRSTCSSSDQSYQLLKDDNDKLNKRLLLLRDEYLKLQKKFLQLQLRYDQLVTLFSKTNGTANLEPTIDNTSLSLPVSDSNNDLESSQLSSGSSTTSSSATTSILMKNSYKNEMNFIQKIMNFIQSLYNNELYSDLLIKFNNGQGKLYAHKFILEFRSKKWLVPDLQQVNELYFNEMSQEIAETLFKWIYTGQLQLFDKSEQFILDLVKYAVEFELKPLVEQCEESLISFVQKHNCIYFYQISEKLNLSQLCDYSAKLVTINWDQLQKLDFENVDTQFLFRLFVEKSRYPLHKAISIENEDLIFLLLMDFDQQSKFKVNEFDNFGNFPLDLALRSGQFQIAKTLIEHQANINVKDLNDWPLIHRYLNEKLWLAAKFLLDHGISIQSTNPDGDSLLHLCADCSSIQEQEQMLDFSKNLLEKNCPVNLQNKFGYTAIHRCIISKNRKLFDLLLQNFKKTQLNLELQTIQDYQTPLALALDLFGNNNDDDEDDDNEDDNNFSNNSNNDEVINEEITINNKYYAKKLIKFKVNLDTISPINGDSLLIQCGRKFNEKAAIYLVEMGANINLINNRGESILHIAAQNGLKDLVGILLQNNVNCNLLTLPPFQWKSSTMDANNETTATNADDNDLVFNQTALHLAILGKHESIIKNILSFHDRSSRKGCLNSILMTPDLNVKNSKHQTPLTLAIELNLISIAELLLSSGSDINVKNEMGLSLLHKAILDGNVLAAQFLLEHGLDIKQKCPLTNECYLQYAIRYNQPAIVELLCQKGANIQQLSTNGNSLLWEALKLYKETGDVEIASILIRYKADPDGWHQSNDVGFEQTLLHRALDENNQDAAIFLIHSGCDIHCQRKPGPDDKGREDCDGQTPLHMACSWGMANVVQTLLEYQVDANRTDNEGKTPLHIAIINQNHPIVELLLQYPNCDPYKSDNFGCTPFALAIKLKSRKTAQSLLKRDSKICEQRDPKGRTYLHLVLQRNDYDSLLFLLDNKVDVNASIKDSQRKSPIHLASETGSEIILRTLILAGSQLNVLTMQNQTALHLASELDKYQIVEILLDLGIDATVQDQDGNTALHLAAIKAHHNTCRVLIEKSFQSSNDNRMDGSSSGDSSGTTTPFQIFPPFVNKKGHNLVHCLAMSSNKLAAANIFEDLIQRYPNWDLNAKDLDGNTALLLAYMCGNGKLCRAIVKEGAALGLRNNQGVSIFNHIMPTRQLLTSLLDSLIKMPQWLDGPDCLECGQKFNLTNRRHHCRHCGRELCSKCSSKEIVIMKFQQDKKSIQNRVCEICYDVLQLGIFN